MKLTREKIFRIPKLAETMNQFEISRELNVHLQTVVYWIRRLRKAGYVVPAKKGKRAMKL